MRHREQQQPRMNLLQTEYMSVDITARMERMFVHIQDLILGKEARNNWDRAIQRRKLWHVKRK